MKVLWIVLGVLLCLCLICGGAGFWLYGKGKGAMNDVDQYAHESLVAIGAKWDAKEMEQRAAPEFGDQNGEHAIPQLMDLLAQKLGPIKGTFTGNVTGYNLQNNNGVSATYADWNADVTFEKGKGSVSMQLINRNGKWQILKFDVDSDALKDSKSGVGKATEPAGNKIDLQH